MLKQIIPDLKILHGFGYTHGDIKLDNICARVGSDGNYKFTLIDFGICCKLPTPSNRDTVDKHLRGNMIYASTRQMQQLRPNRFCDL